VATEAGLGRLDLTEGAGILRSSPFGAPPVNRSAAAVRFGCCRPISRASHVLTQSPKVRNLFGPHKTEPTANSRRESATQCPHLLGEGRRNRICLRSHGNCRQPDSIAAPAVRQFGSVKSRPRFAREQHLLELQHSASGARIFAGRLRPSHCLSAIIDRVSGTRSARPA
jgi:hypothetical protein